MKKLALVILLFGIAGCAGATKEKLEVNVEADNAELTQEKKIFWRLYQWMKNVYKMESCMNGKKKYCDNMIMQ